MSAFALPLLLALSAQPASRPASQPGAGLPVGGTLADITASLTVIYEVDEGQLKTQESWTLRNDTGRAVPAPGTLIELPAGSRRLQLDEELKGFEAKPDSSGIISHGPLGTGELHISGAYLTPADGSNVLIRRALPFDTHGVRVIMEDIDGVELTANHSSERRTRDLNGLSFNIYDFERIPAGSTLELRVQGLPSRLHWPRQLAAVLSVLIVLWCGWVVQSGRAPGAGANDRLGPLSAKARQDRIIKAIELLDAQRQQESISDKKYARRYKELRAELAAAIRETELDPAGGKKGA